MFFILHDLSTASKILSTLKQSTELVVCFTEVFPPTLTRIPAQMRHLIDSDSRSNETPYELVHSQGTRLTNTASLQCFRQLPDWLVQFLPIQLEFSTCLKPRQRCHLTHKPARCQPAHPKRPSGHSTRLPKPNLPTGSFSKWWTRLVGIQGETTRKPTIWEDPHFGETPNETWGTIR